MLFRSHDLLKWLASNLTRMDFVEDAIDEYLNNEKCDLALMIGIGQEKEMQEVLYAVIDKLEDRLDEENDDE